MSRQNPKIEFERKILTELLRLDFNDAVDEYTGEFVDNKWKPKFHYLQGIEHFKQLIADRLYQLDIEKDQWEEQLSGSKNNCVLCSLPKCDAGNMCGIREKTFGKRDK